MACLSGHVQLSVSSGSIRDWRLSFRMNSRHRLTLPPHLAVRYQIVHACMHAGEAVEPFRCQVGDTAVVGDLKAAPNSGNSMPISVGQYDCFGSRGG